MRVARWAVTGSLLINLAFALIVVAASSARRPAAIATTAQCVHRHMPAASPRPVSAGRYLAALRMGWAIS
jgi:hypothetical protein